MLRFINKFRNRLAIFKNHYLRRNGPTFQDQCMKVIMHACSLQLERDESRELAPTMGALGPMILSGGGITTIKYSVFDTKADSLDKTIRKEPWRAFASVTMRLSIQSNPEFEVMIDGIQVPVKDVHKAPGIELIKNLSHYFPLLPKPNKGPTYIPQELPEAKA